MNQKIKLTKKEKLSINIVLFMIMFILFSSFVISYNLQINIVDVDTNENVGDALIEVANLIKKTNVNGYAYFDNIREGSYELIIKRNGYKNIRQNLVVNKDIKTVIQLERDVSLHNIIPIINIITPKNNTNIENKILGVRFSVNSNVNIKECRLLVSKKGFFGFKLYDSVYNLSGNVERTLEANINNGIYNYKISCENDYGVFYSDEYIIKGIGFIEEKEIILNNINSHISNNNDVESNNLEYLKEFDDALDKVKKATIYFKNLDEERKTIVNHLKYLELIEKKQKEIESLKEKRIDLENLKVSDSSYNSRNAELLKLLNKELSSLPISLIIKKKDYYVETVSEEMTFNFVSNYFDAKEIDYSNRLLKKHVKNSRLSHENIIIYTKINILEVEFAKLNKEQINFVNKKYVFDDNFNQEGFFVENFDKNTVFLINQITSDTKYELISSNPIILKFSLDFNHILNNNNNEIELVYFIKKELDFLELENIKSVFINNNDKSTNLITGFSVFDNSSFNSKFLFYFVLFFILSSFIVGFYYYKNVNYNNLNINNKNIIKKGKIFINKSANTFNGLVSNSNNTGSCVQLIEKAIDLIKNNESKEAIKLYPLIIKSYEKLGVKSKNQIKPIIAYLSDLVDLDYLSSKISFALNLVENGQYDSKNDLFMDIDDLYSNLPENSLNKINEKYFYYKKMVELLNLRKREEMRYVKYNYENQINKNSYNNLNNNVVFNKLENNSNNNVDNNKNSSYNNIDSNKITQNNLVNDDINNNKNSSYNIDSNKIIQNNLVNDDINNNKNSSYNNIDNNKITQNNLVNDVSDDTNNNFYDDKKQKVAIDDLIFGKNH
jgi:hypothetical protein